MLFFHDSREGSIVDNNLLLISMEVDAVDADDLLDDGEDADLFGDCDVPGDHTVSDPNDAEIEALMKMAEEEDRHSVATFYFR